MKKLKLITAVMAVFVCLNLVIAVNPVKGKNDNLADLVIEKLNKDVQLTDSQKVILKVKFNAFAGKMKDGDKKSSEKERFDSKKVAYDEYEAFLDSILSTTQKQQQNLKIAEREKTTK